MLSEEDIFQNVLQFLQEKEEQLIMIGTGLPDIAISAQGLTPKHRKQLKADADFIHDECLLPILKIVEGKP